jgi:hypothetical protein
MAGLLFFILESVLFFIFILVFDFPGTDGTVWWALFLVASVVLMFACKVIVKRFKRT